MQILIYLVPLGLGIISLLLGRKLTLHGTGENRRHFLSVDDMADAVEVQGRALDGVRDLLAKQGYTLPPFDASR